MTINFSGILSAAVQEMVNQAVPVASPESAVAGENAFERMTPSSTKQAIEANAATPEQGAKADSAVQPEDLSAVATSGEYADLSGKPSLGSAAAQDASAFASSAQLEALAEGLSDVAISGQYSDLEGTPTLGTAAAEPSTAFATAEQGTRAAASLQKASTRATMVALDTTTDKATYLAELEYEGDFVKRDYSNYSDAVAADTVGGFVARSVQDTSKVWIRNSSVLTNRMFGAKLDGTNDYAATLIAFNVAKALKMAFTFSPFGETYWDLAGASALWDPTVLIRGARRAIPILGSSPATTSLRIANASSLAWNLASTIDWFDLTMKGFTIRGNFNGPLLTIGQNDYSDPVNMVSIEDVSVENGYNGHDNEAVRMNYIAGGTARNLRCVAYANGLGDNKGRGLRARQVEFMNFDGGAFGNAERGIDFTDGFSFNCVFTSNTFENCKWPISNRSANSGAHTFIGPQLTEVTGYEVYSSGCLAGKPIIIMNPNANGPVRVDPSAYQGVRIIDRYPVTTPAVPASGAAFSNATGRDVVVNFWGASSVSSIVIDGVTRNRTATSGEFRFPAASTAVINYGGSLTWHWDNAG